MKMRGLGLLATAAALAGSMAIEPIPYYAPQYRTKRGKTRSPNYRKKGPGRKHRKGPGPSGIAKRVHCPASVLESAHRNRFGYMHAYARFWARLREVTERVVPLEEARQP